MYAKVVITVRLGMEDEGKTDEELLAAADNGGRYGGPMPYFGGRVERNGDGTANITVRTD